MFTLFHLCKSFSRILNRIGTDSIFRMAQVFVYADSLEDHVVAIVVPDSEKFAGKFHSLDFLISNTDDGL